MIDNLMQMTNATKAAVITALNALLGVLVAFGVNLTDAQISSVLAFGNALLALWLMLTYKNSKKRLQ